MNWRQGLWRTWLAFSVCWVAAVGILAYGDVAIPNARNAAIAAKFKSDADACFKTKRAQHENPFDCFGEVRTPDTAPVPPKSYWPYVIAGLGVPSGTLALWFTFLWIAAGFRERDEKSN